jgi:signal peptidase I
MKPSLLVKKQSEKALSGNALAILIAAVLDKGVPFRFTAKGHSMSPFIKDGDIITLHPINEDKLKMGEVVAVFHEPYEKLMVHRLIEKQGWFCILKGDNNPGPDETVSMEKLLGVVKKVERNGEKIRLGMGKERLLIAFLTRKNLLMPLLRKSRIVRHAIS